jgi:uncharacterized membrane protein YfcA
MAGLVVVAFFVEAAAGFGSMVVALTVGAWWFDVNALLGVLVPLNLVLSLWLVVRGARAIDRRFLATLLPLMCAGLLVGSVVAESLPSTRWLQLAFGVFVTVVAAWQLARRSTAALPRTTRASALLAAGVVHGLFATGGPLAVFVASRELTDKRAFRATLALLWVVLNALVLPRLAHQSVLTWESMRLSAVLLLPLAVGLGLGELAHARLDEARFRRVVSVLLVAAGATLTFKTLRLA